MAMGRACSPVKNTAGVGVCVRAFHVVPHIPVPQRGGVRGRAARVWRIMASNPCLAWNNVGGRHQKCLLHYRNLCRAREKNDSTGFAPLPIGLCSIPTDATGCTLVPEYHARGSCQNSGVPAGCNGMHTGARVSQNRTLAGCRQHGRA